MLQRQQLVLSLQKMLLPGMLQRAVHCFMQRPDVGCVDLTLETACSTSCTECSSEIHGKFGDA